MMEAHRLLDQIGAGNVELVAAEAGGIVAAAAEFAHQLGAKLSAGAED
jgi:hypothetical protein